MPYSSEREVLEDLANEQGFAEFSLTKFEIKSVASNEEEVAKLKAQLAASERLIKDMMQEDDPSPPSVPDVWKMLAKWNQEQIDSMDWTPKVQPEPKSPDNIVDFVEYLKSLNEENSEVVDEIMRKMGG